jgi:AcrR family transcriptional regulator
MDSVSSSPPPAALQAQPKRGIRSLNALIRGARTIFERDGYLDARIADIAKEAGVATGSFYTHFNDKQEVFFAVMNEVQQELLHVVMAQAPVSDDVIERIEANNRAYLEGYRERHRLMSLIQQVSTINDEFRQFRLEHTMKYVERNAHAIERMQQAGLVDPLLDAGVAARALSGMVSRLAYQVYVLGDEIPFESLVSTLNRLWINGLGLERLDAYTPNGHPSSSSNGTQSAP